MMSEKFPDGWFRDPEHPGQLRYWDGSAWTDQRMDAPVHSGPGAVVAPGEGTDPNLKRFAIPIAAGLVAVITVFAILAGRSGSGDDGSPQAYGPTPTASAPSARETEAEPESDAGKTLNVGDTVTLGGTEYKVKSATTVSPEEDEDEESEESDETGPRTYVAVDLQVANRGPQDRTFPSGAATVLAGGDRYQSTGEAAIAAGYEDSLLFNPIRSEETATGIIVFEVPLNALDGVTLELTDLFGVEKATVRLGL